MLPEKKDDNLEFLRLRGRVQPKAHIIAVGGGKGGVGKSFVSSSLAIFLAHLGYKTCAIDLDLGGANLHTALGAGLPGKSLEDFISNPTIKLEDLAEKTPFPKLKIIGGASDEMRTADISEHERSRLMSAIFNMEADFIVLDLAAGTQKTTIDFFLMAQSKLVVMTPEPTSIENAYRFMKAAFYRRIKRFEFQLHLEDVISEIMSDRKKYSVRSPGDLFKAVNEFDPEGGKKLEILMRNLQFDIVLNQTRSYKEAELGHSVQSVCTKYFGVPCRLAGQIEHDNAVWQSQRKRRHLLIEYPHSRLYAQLMGMSRRLASLKAQDQDLPKLKAN